MEWNRDGTKSPCLDSYARVSLYSGGGGDLQTAARTLRSRFLPSFTESVCALSLIVLIGQWKKSWSPKRNKPAYTPFVTSVPIRFAYARA